MERRQDLLIDQMYEKRKSRTNSGSGASAPGRIELAFTVMATMSVEQAWGRGGAGEEHRYLLLEQPLNSCLIGRYLEGGRMAKGAELPPRSGGSGASGSASLCPSSSLGT